MYRFLIIALLLTNKLTAQSLTGIWRGEFLLQQSFKAPFIFEIDKNNEVILINGEERFNTGKLTVRKDSVFIPLDQFDNELAFVKKKNILKGVLRKQEGLEVLATLTAEKGKTQRFITKGQEPVRDFSGEYEVVFKPEKGNEYKAVGLFKQEGNKLTATFLKASGDSRYQEGIVEGNKFYLSSFIGSTPGYYYGEINDQGDLQGEQIATKSRITITGRFNSQVQVVDAYQLTTTKDARFNFALPDINGNIISSDDEKFRNKVLVIAITGTWCPNCIDEAKFLSPWYMQNKDRGVEIIAIHFERQPDAAYARKVMNRYRERFNVEYTQLFGGTTAKEDILKALPGLNDFSAFPTTIFLDKSGKPAKVHTGFSGPATGKYYDDFIKDFNREIDQLLSESAP